MAAIPKFYWADREGPTVRAQTASQSARRRILCRVANIVDGLAIVYVIFLFGLALVIAVKWLSK